MRNYVAENVDTYIANAPLEARPHLEELRKIVLSTLPNAEEQISWGIPYYRYHGLVAGFSPFKKHVSFGFCDVLSDHVRKQLEEQGYATGSKTVQIKFGQPVPTAAIQQILNAKAQLNEATHATK